MIVMPARTILLAHIAGNTPLLFVGMLCRLCMLAPLTAYQSQQSWIAPSTCSFLTGAPVLRWWARPTPSMLSSHEMLAGFTASPV